MLSDDLQDFIMVVTVEGEVETVPLHCIARVHAALHAHPLAVLSIRGQGLEADRTLVIQETAECFLKRAEHLQSALCTRDLKGINQHLAPAWAERAPEVSLTGAT